MTNRAGVSGVLETTAVHLAAEATVAAIAQEANMKATLIEHSARVYMQCWIIFFKKYSVFLLKTFSNKVFRILFLSNTDYKFGEINSFGPEPFSSHCMLL